MATKRPGQNAPPAKRRRTVGWWLAIAVGLLAVNYLAASRATRTPGRVGADLSTPGSFSAAAFSAIPRAA